MLVSYLAVDLRVDSSAVLLERALGFFVQYCRTLHLRSTGSDDGTRRSGSASSTDIPMNVLVHAYTNAEASATSINFDYKINRSSSAQTDQSNTASYNYGFTSHLNSNA